MAKRIEKIKRNRYDYSIILLISLISFGIIGGALQPIRLMSIFFMPSVIAWIALKKHSIKIQKIIFFLIVWYIYLFFSIFWTLDQDQGFKEIFYYLVHFLLFFQLIAWSEKANDPKRSVILGWVLVLLLTLPIAIYEVNTLNHLSLDVFESDLTMNLDGEIKPYRYASVTFGNYNGYVVNMMYCFPFLLAAIFRETGYFFKVLLLVLFSSIAIIFINASRGGFLVTFICLFVFLYYIAKKFRLTLKKISSLFLVLALGFGFIYFLSLYSDSYFSRILYRSSFGTSSFTDDNSRSAIIIAGIGILKDSNFLGYGVGSELLALKNTSVDIPNSHNLFLEILIQYGIFIFIGFIYVLYRIFLGAFDLKDERDKIILYGVMFSFLPLMVINSGYLTMSSFWVFISSLLIISTNYKIVKN